MRTTYLPVIAMPATVQEEVYSNPTISDYDGPSAPRFGSGFMLLGFLGIVLFAYIINRYNL